MTRLKSTAPRKYIHQLNMNQLEGRMVRLDNQKVATEILFVGGLSANLEYWWGLIRALGDFGSVSAPDLPGIGGMTSFYKIKRRPTIDSYADYLATFTKLRYGRRRIVIVGVGFGFVIATRMLAKYPEIAHRVNLIVSLGGYADAEDFKLGSKILKVHQLLSYLTSKKIPSLVLRKILYNDLLLRWQYGRRLGRNAKSDAANALIIGEVRRWQSSDLRTFGAIVGQLATFTNCNSVVDVKAWHVFLNEKTLIRNRVEQHLRVIFPDLTIANSTRKNSYVLNQNKRSASYFLPNELKQALRSI